MHKLHVLPCVALVLLAFIAVPACARNSNGNGSAGEATVGSSDDSPVASDCIAIVEDGWLRLPPVAMPMLAGFGHIRNACDSPITIVGVGSAAFGEVSLHETRIVDGISRMRALPELMIAPGESATLEPGGKHLMLMQPARELQVGDTVQIEFQLADGRALRGAFRVRKSGA